MADAVARLFKPGGRIIAEAAAALVALVELPPGMPSSSATSLASTCRRSTGCADRR